MKIGQAIKMIHEVSDSLRKVEAVRDAANDAVWRFECATTEPRSLDDAEELLLAMHRLKEALR